MGNPCVSHSITEAQIDDNYELLCRLWSPLVRAEEWGLSTPIAHSTQRVKLPECRLQFKCAAMFGDIFARSWMKKFYVAADTSLTHMEAYQLVLDAMDQLKTMIAAFDVDSLTCDVFGNGIEKHTAIWKLYAAEKANGNLIVMKMLEKTLDVLERQYLPYTKFNLEEAAKDTRATPTHNMGAEEIVGLFSAAQDRAPNATILFLNSKIKARRNRTIIKLQELGDGKRSGMIKAAIIIAKQEKKKSIRYASELHSEIVRRMQQKDVKRQQASRKTVEKKIASIKSKSIDVMMEVLSCTREQALKVRDILDWKVTDSEILHKWLGEKNPLALELWHGHIEKRKGASYCVCYWEHNGCYEDGTDYLVSPRSLAADYLCEELHFVYL